jgi:hypothetical protein
MKILSFILLFFMLSCSSNRSEWDSGGRSEDSYQNQRAQEQEEDLRIQSPGPSPLETRGYLF